VTVFLYSVIAFIVALQIQITFDHKNSMSNRKIPGQFADIPVTTKFPDIP